MPVFREDLSINDANLLDIPLSVSIDPFTVASPVTSPSRANFDSSNSDLQQTPNLPGIFAPDWLLANMNEDLDGVRSDPESSADGSSSPSVDGVTVVSIGIPASELVRHADRQSGLIASCSLEACSGTHVPDTSFLNAFVVTRVEDMEGGGKRVTAVSRVCPFKLAMITAVFGISRECIGY